MSAFHKEKIADEKTRAFTADQYFNATIERLKIKLGNRYRCVDQYDTEKRMHLLDDRNVGLERCLQEAGGV